MKRQALRQTCAQAEASLVSLPSDAANSNREKGQLDSLTGLRFYAAFAVFLSHGYHFNYFGLSGTAPFLLSYMGHLGVSVFYVLSGFVLFYRYWRPEAPVLNLKGFYGSRLARVYPVFLLLTLAAIPMELFSARKSEFWGNLLQSVSLTHCATSGACGSFNDVGWSISVEGFFYLMFPLLLAAFYKPTRLIGFLAAFVTGFVALQVLFSDGFYATHRFPFNRVAEFAMGMGAGWFYLAGLQPDASWRKRLTQHALWLTGLCILLLVGFPLLLTPLGLQNQDYLFYMLPSAVLILTLALTEKAGRAGALFAMPLVVFGGEISYSFYLVHNLLMRYVKHGLSIVFHLDLASLPPGVQIGTMLAWLLVSLAAAAGLYWWVEKPCRKIIRNQLAGIRA